MGSFAERTGTMLPAEAHKKKWRKQKACAACHLYLQNSKLTPAKWTFRRIYISPQMCELAEVLPERGLDRILKTAGFS
jgi:hypothetical protein